MLFSNAILRYLTNEAFFPPFILLLYLLQYFTFSKRYRKDLLSNIFFFSRATELRKVLLVVE